MDHTDAIALFISQLDGDPRVAAGAANGLLAIGKRSPESIAPHLKLLGRYARSRHPHVACAAIECLGLIGTVESLKAIESAFLKCDPAILRKRNRPEGLVYRMGELIVTVLTEYDDDRDSDAHIAAINALFTIIAREDCPHFVRGYAIDFLCLYVTYCRENYDIDPKVPQEVYATVGRLASGSDKKLAALAMTFIGTFSGHIAKYTKSTKTSNIQVRIDFSKSRIIDIIKEYGPHRFSMVHPEDFETIMSAVFLKDGYSIEKTAYVGDYGADFVATRAPQRVAVQVKRYAESTLVSVSDVNQVLGAKQFYKCNSCTVITTSHFTKPAINLGVRADVDLWGWSKLGLEVKRLFGVEIR
ncbi:Restriction endonuclease [Pirellulimonas nuda]|uniref:Restriction endonuclease n=1 Tax=Pirellulimonas nuda TaxID=2528009 RepID=A0A518D8F7_9BACT|nr:restriction endonuclease [Pirellulimonas nuda]QDU87758.1 Restriction endonuclease [Pirellulimonas nuda]